MNEQAMQNEINDLAARVKELEKMVKELTDAGHASKPAHTATHHGKDEKHR